MVSLPTLGSRRASTSNSRGFKPGWKVEKLYNPNALMHNWLEERIQREEAGLKYAVLRQSENPWYQTKPNVILRRSSVYPRKDIHKEMLFGHHGNIYDNNMITLYDENFNKRIRPSTQRLPELRKWDGRNLCWFPEKSDFPLKGEPTNWGYRTLKYNQHQIEASELSSTNYRTSYQRDFYPKTLLEKAERLAVPKLYVQ